MEDKAEEHTASSSKVQNVSFIHICSPKGEQINFICLSERSGKFKSTFPQLAILQDQQGYTGQMWLLPMHSSSAC